MTEKIINSEAKTLEQLFANKYDYYEVPEYQRSFSWDTENFQQFWDDVIFALNRDRDSYFMGAIVLKKRGEHKIEIIDGQQRLAVITILLAIISKKLDELEHNEARDIVQQFIVAERRDRRTKKLILNKENKSFFEKYIQRLNEINPKEEYNRESKLAETNKKIFKAYKFLEDEVTKFLERESSGERKTNLLLDLTDCLREKLEFIAIYTNKDSDAYIIFETLNERGEELSISDLLKNYLFSKAKEGGYLEEIIDYWDEITNILFELKNLSIFLRHYWISTRKLVREKDLYRELKKEINSGREAFNIVQTLKEEAKIYEGIINHNSSIWRNNNELKELINTIQILNIRQCRPLLLSSYKKFNLSDFKKILELVINLSFRYGTICNFNPNDLERLYGSIGRKIRTNEITSISQIKAIFNELYPNDSNFYSNFIGKIIRFNEKVPKCILCKINDFMGDYREIAAPNITLEHIIPKTLNEEWENYLNDNELSHQELLYRIGNMTILAENDNRSASNKFFTYKKEEVYRSSILPVNKDLLVYNEWNEDNIVDREKKLCEIAKRIWKL